MSCGFVVLKGLKLRLLFVSVVISFFAGWCAFLYPFNYVVFGISLTCRLIINNMKLGAL